MTTLDKIELSEPLPPIILFAYNRPNLLDKILQGIKEQTILPPKIYAFVDGPKEHFNETEKENILKSISLLKAFTKVQVILHTQSHNQGLRNNILQGITKVLLKHKSAIILEDDIYPCPIFYETMSKLLNYYEDSPVFSITAHPYPLNELKLEIKSDFFVNSLFKASHGWATWADRWKHLGEKIFQGVNPYQSILNIPRYPHFSYTTRLLYEYNHSLNSEWSPHITLLSHFYNYVHITPSRQLTTNIGAEINNSTHIHSPKILNKYPNFSLKNPAITLPPDLSINRKLNKEIHLLTFFGRKIDIWICLFLFSFLGKSYYTKFLQFFYRIHNSKWRFILFHRAF